MTAGNGDAGVIDPFVMYRRPGGVFARSYCSAPHPDHGDVWCRRAPNHPGDHAAFVFAISAPPTHGRR